MKDLIVLAHDCANLIENDQNAYTDISRKKALTYFRNVIDRCITENRKPSDLIDAAKNARDDVIKNGRFGIWGKRGSSFLKHINAFIEQAEFLENRRYRFYNKEGQFTDGNGIKRLALYHLHKAKEAQTIFTRASRNNAIKNILNVINQENQETKDDTIIKSIANEVQTIKLNRDYGLRGEKGSSFLRIMQGFMKYAGRILTIRSSERITCAKAKNMNTIEDMLLPTQPLRQTTLKSQIHKVTISHTIANDSRETSCLAVSKEVYSPKLFLAQIENKALNLLDYKREACEKIIDDYMNQYFNNTNEKRIWNNYLNKVALGEKLYTDTLFFTNTFDLEKQSYLISPDEAVNRKFNAALRTYKEIVDNKSYHQYLREKNLQSQKQEHHFKKYDLTYLKYQKQEEDRRNRIEATAWSQQLSTSSTAFVSSSIQ